MSQNSTAHWSIGEVLSLLQEEFPEVTISKIRFLESQGLIDPERTPSGYRRFYDHDFDRLRWILVQQRDHYLPLKVIRDRLELADEIGAPEAGGDIEIVEESQIAPATDQGDEPMEEAVETDDHRTLPVLDLTEDAPVPVESLVLPVPEVEKVTLVPNSQPEAQEEVEVVSAGQMPVPLADPAEDADSKHADRLAVDDQSVDRPVEANEAETNRVAANEVDERDAKSAASVPTEELALSREELAEAAGCDTRLLHELERYNLIAGHAVANGLVFGQHDLDVALIAVALGQHGLEPRHLRAFRLSAEREVGLVAQIVEPMLHRRSPGAREASYAVLSEMMDLATSLHDSMVRQVVDEQFPNR